MKHTGRFFLNLLAPAPLASVLMFAGAILHESESNISREIQWLPVGVGFAYLFSSPFSLAHACWLHRRYRAGTDPRSHRAIGVSTASGTLVGVAMCLLFGGGQPQALFIPLGAAVGALNGLLQFLIREKPDSRS